MLFSSEKKGQRVGGQRVSGLITVPLLVKCNGVSVCNKPEMEGGGHWEAGMMLEFSGTRVNRNGATRTLAEMVVENQGRGRASHQGVGGEMGVEGKTHCSSSREGCSRAALAKARAAVSPAPL